MVFHSAWLRQILVFYLDQYDYNINPFKPEFTIAVFIHFKPRI